MALDKQEKYKGDKARVFRLIVGQCVPMMKSKLEHEPTYSTVETSKDVVELMKLMKKLVYSTTSNQYEFWTMQASLTTLLTLTQHEKEGLASFGKKLSWKQQRLCGDHWSQPSTGTKLTRNKRLQGTIS